MAVKTLTVGPGKLQIGDSENITTFESQTRSCKLVPNVDTDDPIDVLSGEQIAGDRSEAFTLEGTFLQDFGATLSTTEWLFEHRGESHPFEYTPNNSAGKKITGTLQVEAIDIGGDVKTKAESDFEFQLLGAPVIVAATPPVEG